TPSSKYYLFNLYVKITDKDNKINIINDIRNGYCIITKFQISFLSKNESNQNAHYYNNNIKLYNGENFDEGSLIENPVYIYDENILKNEPICYIKTNNEITNELNTVNVKFSLIVYPIINISNINVSCLNNNIVTVTSNIENQIINNQDNFIKTDFNLYLNNLIPGHISENRIYLKWILTSKNSQCYFYTTEHDLLTVFNHPITEVEGQISNPTVERVRFSIRTLVKNNNDEYKSGDVFKIANDVGLFLYNNYLLSNEGGDFFVNENKNRWKYFTRKTNDIPLNLHCDHRAAIVSHVLKMLGIKCNVYRVHATCFPVPTPPGDGVLYGVNDYVSTYIPSSETNNRFKTDYYYQYINYKVLYFYKNRYEGCLCVENGSIRRWWYYWPFSRNGFETTKDLIAAYEKLYDQSWYKLYQGWDPNEPLERNVALPLDKLENLPDILKE
ncbi:MAG: hypothetical protein GYA62_04745, partial [Bacteroidales bacterium]|nr:hypothetical protein [Bacteroidales bacterium]